MRKINLNQKWSQLNAANPKLSLRIGKQPNWWTPVWRGLVADPVSKHRKEMGPSLWMFLYLLAYANRTTGVVRRSVQVMSKDTGYPIRTVQLNLRRLSDKAYIVTSREGRYLKIEIVKWKAFHVSSRPPLGLVFDPKPNNSTQRNE